MQVDHKIYSGLLFSYLVLLASYCSLFPKGTSSSVHPPPPPPLSQDENQQATNQRVSNSCVVSSTAVYEYIPRCIFDTNCQIHIYIYIWSTSYLLLLSLWISLPHLFKGFDLAVHFVLAVVILVRRASHHELRSRDLLSDPRNRSQDQSKNRYDPESPAAPPIARSHSREKSTRRSHEKGPTNQ